MEQENKEQQKQEEQATKEEPKKEDWDKEKQRADQAEAVAKKAREESEALQEALAETQAKIATMEQQQKKAAEDYQKAKDEFDDMDPLSVDQNVINNLKKLKAKQDELEKRNAQLEEKAKHYEEAEKERTTQTRKQATIEKILKPLDEEFGAKYRNEAVKLADQLVDKGEINQPTEPIDAMVLMRRCYKEVTEKAKAKEKSSVPSDSGLGGVSHSEPVGKAGSKQEVLADMRKNTSTWKGKT